MARVAVLGGGGAGIGAAWQLQADGHDVVLIEAAPQLGGNCLGMDVPGSDGRLHRIDIGVSDFNTTTFTYFAELLEELRLETKPINQSAGFVSPTGQSLWACVDGDWQFRRRLAGAEGMVDEAAAFRGRAVEVLEDPRFANWTTEQYLNYIEASPAFREAYFYPRASGCFPLPDRDPRQLRILPLVEF